MMASPTTQNLVIRYKTEILDMCCTSMTENVVIRDRIWLDLAFISTDPLAG